MHEAQTAAPIITATGKQTHRSDREQRAGEEKQAKFKQEIYYLVKQFNA